MQKPPLRVVEGGSMDKQKALEAALAQIDKNFGKGSIMRLGANDRIMDIEAISTGSLGLDIALGIGGLPRGRVIEIYGPESSGKTTLALSVVSEAQRKGGICAFVDAEHALDPVYARKLGVKVEDLLISQPDDGEQALEIVDTLVRSGAVDVLVVDSVAALTPKAELEGEMGDMQPGMQARLMSKALRKLTASISKSKCMVIFINQIRMKIGIMFGNPETTTGGNALKFYASVRLDIRRIGQIKDREEVVGNQTRVKVVKNKVAPPFKQGRVRHHVRRGHLQDRRAGRPRRQGRHHREVGRLVLVRRRAHRPGPREHQGVPQGASQGRRRDREGRAPERRPDRRQDAASGPGGDEAADAEEGPETLRGGRDGGRHRQEGNARQAVVVIPEVREANYPGPRTTCAALGPGSPRSLRSGRDDRPWFVDSADSHR